MRRVRGLRREEVAKLAAISPDYYVRLEQGRNDSPSPQVVDALARALRLDEDGARYLHKLAGHARSAIADTDPQEVPNGIGLLLQGLREVPAFVHGKYLDVLAANPLAEALFPSQRIGVNLLRAAFTDPAVRSMYPEWDTVVAEVIANARLIVGADGGSERLRPGHRSGNGNLDLPISDLRTESRSLATSPFGYPFGVGRTRRCANRKSRSPVIHCRKV